MSLLPQEIIRTKRDGRELDPAAIDAFIRGFGDESVSEGQIAAFAMAVFFKGMSRSEAVALTVSMRDSGEVLSWPELDCPVVDKHSTGGVGDNVSLMLAPIAAACGLAVPMISGRGLGHTGGTLDKMEAIPGYTAMPDSSLFRKVVASSGCAIIGQTGNLAPADKRFYGIRDVTATVESVPLITASILSKKLAAGLGALVLDVKCGNGAFMDNPHRANELARSLVEVAVGAGMPTTALVTDMNQPLASAAGNAVEVRNAVDFLTGKIRDSRLLDVTLALAAEMLVSGGLASNVEQARTLALKALDEGSAAERFNRMVAELGGPLDFIADPDGHLETAPIVSACVAGRQGYITGYDTRAVGLCVVELGGGRTRPGDPVDHTVGLTSLLPIGTRVEKDTPFAFIHARNNDQLALAEQQLRAAVKFGDAAPDTSAVVIGRHG